MWGTFLDPQEPDSAPALDDFLHLLMGRNQWHSNEHIKSHIQELMLNKKESSPVWNATKAQAKLVPMLASSRGWCLLFWWVLKEAAVRNRFLVTLGLCLILKAQNHLITTRHWSPAQTACGWLMCCQVWWNKERKENQLPGQVPSTAGQGGSSCGQMGGLVHPFSKGWVGSCNVLGKRRGAWRINGGH